MPDAIRGLQLLKADFPVELEILGDGPEAEACQQLVIELNLTDQVHFRGFVSPIREYLLKSKCLILTSSHEGLPTVIIEALAYGLEVISTDCPTGPRELLKNGRFGHLIEIGNIEQLADAMKVVLEKKTPYASKDLVNHLRQFTISESSQEYEKVCFAAFTERIARKQ